jgi:hypothetical protein
MNDLREVEESRLSEFEQLLTLQIALASLAGYRRHHGRADEQVLADPVIASNWLALCLASKSATRILVYGYTKGAKPVLRIEIRIEGRCNPSVRFDGSLLTISDNLGHLRAYELTYGEQVRALNL